jgi:hypothetical protein
MVFQIIARPADQRRSAANGKLGMIVVVSLRLQHVIFRQVLRLALLTAAETSTRMSSSSSCGTRSRCVEERAATIRDHQASFGVNEQDADRTLRRSDRAHRRTHPPPRHRRSRRSQGPDTVQRHTDLADATGSAG